MKKSKFYFLLSVLLSFFMVVTPTISLAELEFSDEFVSPIENEISEDSQLDVDEEIVDYLPINEAPINPEFTRVMSSQNGERNYGLQVDPLKVHTTYDLQEEIPRQMRQFLPARYDLRDFNRVTPVKDQGPNGSCWAFASYGSAESVLMPREFTDFSEKHMRNTHGFDWGPDDGGTWQVAAAYLSRWSGPIDEKDDPYHPYGFTSPRGLMRSKDVDKIMNIPDVRNGFDTDGLKQAILTYGAAYTTINGSEYYLNQRTMGSYHPGGNGYANHAVTIVGWDDNFSRYNFRYTPPGDGAWIIKNSWGRNWKSMGGYYYVSYHDAFVGRSNAIFKLKNKTPGKEIWYYDDLGMNTNYGNGPTAYFSNVFGPVRNNVDVVEVGFFVPSNGARYEVYVTTGSGNVSFNNRKRVASGTAEYAGYITVPITSTRVNSGEYFAPIVKLTTPGYNYPIPIEVPVRGYSSRARANRGQSYISYNGSNWMDMTSQRYNANVCLKAMTMPAGSNPNPNPDPDPDPNPDPQPDPTEDVKISSVFFRTKTLNLKVGDTRELLPTILPANATNKKLNFSVSPSRVATVQNGVLRAIAPGTATVSATATDGTYKRASFTLVVESNETPGEKVNYISLSPNNNRIKVGDSYKLTSTIMPANAANKNLRFESSNSNIATVDNDGTVKGVGVGSARITAFATDGSNKSQTAYVTVERGSNNDKRIRISASVATKDVRSGNAQTITVNAKDSNNSNLRYVKVDLKVNTPNGNTINKSAYTDYYGNARIVLSAYELSASGEYTVNITGGGETYQSDSTTISFNVNDGRPIFETVVTPNQSFIFNNGSIALTIQTRYQRYAVSGANLEIQIETPDGTVHRNNGSTDNYGRAVYNYKPENGPAGTYHVKVIASRNGYQNSVGRASFEVKKYQNPNSINIELNSDKDRYEMGDRATVNIKLTNGNGYVLRNTPVEITVTGPNNFVYNLTKYTNSYGLTEVHLTPNVNMGEGKYTISAKSSLYNYSEGNAKIDLNFGQVDPVDPTPDEPVDPVEPDNPVDPVVPEEQVYEMIQTDAGQKMIEENKNNPDFILFDVRTKAEFNESHIDGAIHHDYYAKDHKDYLKTLDKNKTYLVYCRTQVRSGATAEIMKDMGFKKIYWMYGGMTKWLRENRPSVFPEYEKILDINMSADKASYRAGENVSVNLKVTDFDANYIRKANVVLQLKDETNRTLETKSVVTDNSGQASASFTAPNQNAKYKVVAVASYNEFEKANGIAMFEVGGNESFKSFSERERLGHFSHINKSDYEYESLQNNYGKNILQYFVKDARKSDRQILDLIDPSKKTVLVFGYPGCGPCVDMWKAMAPLDHKEYNFVEIVTSVEEDVDSTIRFVDNVLKELNIEHFRSHIYYDARDKVWASRLGFLTTPNTVLLDENGRLVNIAGALDKDGLYKLLDKTFDLKVGENNTPVEPPKPDVNYNAKLTLNVNNKKIFRGQTVTLSGNVKNMRNRNLNKQQLRYSIKFPNGEFETGVYDRYSSAIGNTKLWFTADNSSPYGVYEVSLELISNDYVAEKVVETFEVVDRNQPEKVNIDLKLNGEEFKLRDVIRMELNLKDANNRAISKQAVRFVLTFPDGKSYNYDRSTNYYGNSILTYTTATNSPQGKYTISATLVGGKYNNTTVSKTFTLGSNTPDYPTPDPFDPNKKELSYQDRYRNGEFNHINDGDLGPKLRSIYGKNLSNYSITNMDGRNVTIGQIMDGTNPTVIALGYPSCGGCQSSWRNLVNIDKSNFTMIEAMTSGNASTIRNTLSRLRLSSMESYFYYNASTLFNVINSNYVPVLLFLDKDGNVSNVSYFESNRRVTEIVNQISGTTSK